MNWRNKRNNLSKITLKQNAAFPIQLFMLVNYKNTLINIFFLIKRN